MDRLLAEIDNGVDFSGETLFHSVLEWLGAEGFGVLSSILGIPFKTVRHFRDRYLIEALTPKGLPNG